MSTEHLLHDIRELNLSYLLLVQRLVNADRELAKFRLKINDDMADLMSTIALSDLIKLAQCNQLLCSFSLDSPAKLYSLIESPHDDDLRRMHAAILLSGPNRRGGDRRSGEERRQNASGPPGGQERRAGERRQQARRRQAEPPAEASERVYAGGSNG